jgi:dTMP kinase
MDWIIEANRPAAALLRPDLNIFIDVDPEITMARIEMNRMTKELFEQKERLVETRKRYFEAFELLKDKEQILIVDGNRDEDEVAEDIWKQLSLLF